MVETGVKKIIGAVVIGVVCTSLAATDALNLSDLLNVFLGLGGWIPMAMAIASF